MKELLTVTPHRIRTVVDSDFYMAPQTLNFSLAPPAPREILVFFCVSYYTSAASIFGILQDGIKPDFGGATWCELHYGAPQKGAWPAGLNDQAWAFTCSRFEMEAKCTEFEMPAIDPGVPFTVFMLDGAKMQAQHMDIYYDNTFRSLITHRDIEPRYILGFIEQDIKVFTMTHPERMRALQEQGGKNLHEWEIRNLHRRNSPDTPRVEYTIQVMEIPDREDKTFHIIRNANLTDRLYKPMVQPK